MPEDVPPDWDWIVERNAEQVFRIAFRILGSVHDAEDVCQIAFVEAIGMHQTQPVQSWTGLLVRLVTLRSIDLLRQRRNTLEIGEGNQVSNMGPVDDAIGAEMAAWLRLAVQQLPEQQALVFSLCCFEQLDRNEVAAVLNISPEAVSAALYRARQRLMTEFTVFNGGR